MGYTTCCFHWNCCQQLPQGRTIHNLFNFSVADLKQHEFVSDISTDKLNQLRPRLNTTNLIVLVIDVKLLVESKEIDIDPPGPRTRRTLLFSKFKTFELTQQMREADDHNYTAMLNQMRNPLPGCNPINSTINITEDFGS